MYENDGLNMPAYGAQTRCRSARCYSHQLISMVAHPGSHCPHLKVKNWVVGQIGLLFHEASQID